MHLFPKHPPDPDFHSAPHSSSPLASGTQQQPQTRCEFATSSSGSDGAKEASSLLQRRQQDVPITLKDNYAALAAVRSSIADIKPGTFIRNEPT